MDYDFSILCSDQLDKLEKRLTFLKKSFVKEYRMALTVINHIEDSNQREELYNAIENLFNDEITKTSISWTARMVNVQKVIEKHL